MNRNSAGVFSRFKNKGEKLENEEKLACDNIFDNSSSVFGCTFGGSTSLRRRRRKR
jgi:hypothetical protein